MYNMDLQQQANNIKLFGLFSPVKSCCCGCTLYCAMMTFAVLNLIGGLDSIATLFKFIQSPGLALYFFLVMVLQFTQAYLGFNCKKSELYARLYLTLMKISYFFGQIILGIMIILLAISNEIVVTVIQKQLSRYGSEDDRIIDEENISRIISLVLVLVILITLIQTIVGGYFLLVVHSFYVYEWKIRTAYYSFQNQQQQPMHVINQPVVIPIQQQQIQQLPPHYIVAQGMPIQSNVNLQQQQY